MSKKTKAAQVEKVAKETKVDPQDLARLPQDALQKLDDLKDDDLLGGDDAGLPPLPDQADGHDGLPMPSPAGVPPVTPDPIKTPPESPSEKLPVEPQTTAPDVAKPTSDVHAGVMIGYHPVTGEPVYQ